QPLGQPLRLRSALCELRTLYDAGERISQIVGDDAEHLVPRGHGPPQRFLDVLALGDVPKHHREERDAAYADLRNRGLGRKLLAVPPKAEQVPSFGDFAGGLASCCETGKMPVMSSTEPIGNQHLERLPYHLGSGIAEDALCALVEDRHSLMLVDRNDGV